MGTLLGLVAVYPPFVPPTRLTGGDHFYIEDLYQ